MAEILPINFLDYLSMHTKIDLRVLATSTHGHDSDMLLTADAMQQENLGASNLSKTWYSKTSLIQKTGTSSSGPRRRMHFSMQLNFR